MDLLFTCKNYIPNLNWEWYKKPSTCIGYSDDGFIQAKMFFIDNNYVRISISIVENTISTDFIYEDGEATKVDALFQELYRKLDNFTLELSHVLNNRPKNN